MRPKLYFLFMLLCFLSTPSMLAQTISVSQNDALIIAQREFKNKDVDYYILDNNPVEWVIFVDAEPMKGWEHECYTLTIPKKISTSIDDVVLRPKTSHKLPPEGNYLPLLVKNRYETNTDNKPYVAKAKLSDADKAIAQRTYAVILSGGYDKMSNHERYWNDCSFIYQTLINRYGVPKGHIYPIMADGNNPAEDM